MTIVTERNVETALRYLAEDPHPLALARMDLTIAENHYEAVRAQVYLRQEGTVAERDARTQTDSTVIKAKTELAEAEFQVERHKARLKASDALIEVFRTECANARLSEKIR